MASPDQAQQPTKTDAPESNAEQGKSRTGWYLGGGVAVAAFATMFFSINRSSSVQPNEGSEKSPLVDKSRDLQTELAAKCGDLLGKFEPSKELAPLLTKGEVKLTLWNPESIGMQDKTFQRGALNFGNEVRIDSRLVEALQKGLAAGGASPEQSRELTAMLILPDVTAGVAHFKSTRELESLIGKPLGGTPLEQEFVNELIAARTFDALKVSLTPEQAEILRKAVAASPEVENHWNESVRRSDALTHSPQAVFGYTKQAHPDAKSITSLTPDPEGAKKVIQQLMDKNKAEINQPTEAAPIEKPTGLTAEDRAKVARQIAEYQANIRKQMRVENETARVENQIATNNILSPERAVRWSSARLSKRACNKQLSK
jgi:hypothetical protein